MQTFIQEHAPCYIYEKSVIEKQCQILQNTMKGIGILYSIKANPYAPVVHTILEQGMGADAASAKEVDLALAEGANADNIFYSAPGKSDDDIKNTWGKCRLVADSMAELQRIEKIAAERNETILVGIRIHPTLAFNGESSSPSKFGISEALLPDLLELMPKLSHIHINGLHVHLQSQVLDAVQIGMYYRNCYQLAEKVANTMGISLSYINFGSSIGIVYGDDEKTPVNLDFLQQAIDGLVAYNKDSLQAKLYIESGRFLTCESGTYYTKVVDKKQCGDQTYVVVQSALNGFLRPAIAQFVQKLMGDKEPAGMEPLFTSYQEVHISALNNHKELEQVTVVGNLCTALDVWATDIMLPNVEIGDILAISHAGSYGRTLSPVDFSSLGDIGEYLI